MALLTAAIVSVARASTAAETDGAASAADASSSPRGPKQVHTGADLMVFSPDFSVEPGYGAGLHGHYRLAGLFLVGLSYTNLSTDSHYEKCRASRCPRGGGLIAAAGELHPLDRSKIPVLDPWIGLRFGPAWSYGDFSFAALERGTEPGTTFGAGFELALGLDLHLWYGALGIGYRVGSVDEIGYGGLAARVELRLF